MEKIEIINFSLKYYNENFFIMGKNKGNRSSQCRLKRKYQKIFKKKQQFSFIAMINKKVIGTILRSRWKKSLHLSFSG